MNKSIFYDHLITAAKQEKKPVSEIIEYAASLGYVGADVCWCGESELTKTHELLKKFGISISSVYRFWKFYNLFDKDEAKSFFACVSSLGCKTVMIIPQKSGQTTDDIEFDRAATALNQLCDMAKEYEITVTVEDFDGTNVVVCNTASLKRIFNAVPKLKHAFDTGNYAYFNESELDAFELFKDKIAYVHLKDRLLVSTPEILNPETAFGGREVAACAVGEGFVEIKECINRLVKNGYNGYFSVELFWHNNMKEAIQKSAEYLNNL